MAGGCAWSRRVSARMRSLRGLVRDTQKAMHDVCDILHFDPEILISVQSIGNQVSRSTALVLLGSSPSARARLLHCLLGRQILPDPTPRGCRWLKIQYGSTAAARLSVANSEFELVEELECNNKPWNILPTQDLIRQNYTDLSTILEVEINNQFLKEGLQIVVPPDLESDPGTTDYRTLKKLHSELYAKRESILKNFNPVYLYAIDRIGKNLFSEHICNSVVTCQSEEDLWSSFNLYYINKGVGVGGGQKKIEVVEKEWKSSSEPSVFTGENCLDLHQVKSINPKAQLLFVMFSDSEDISPLKVALRTNEATESAEDTVSLAELPESEQGYRDTAVSPERLKARRRSEELTAFMNDLLDNWEIMTCPTQKHYVKSQWVIVDDAEMLRGGDGMPPPTYTSAAIQSANDGVKLERVVGSRPALLNTVVKFATDCMHTYLLEYSTGLSEVHVKLLQQFILASFDMARELQVVPKKIQYVATQEQHLYDTINEKFSEGDKKQELLQIMQEVLSEMRAEVNNMDWSVDDLPCHQDKRFMISNSVFYSSSRASPEALLLSSGVRVGLLPSSPEEIPSDGEEAVSYESNFDDYEIVKSNDGSFTVSESYRMRGKPDEDSVAVPPHTCVEHESVSWWGDSRLAASTTSSCTTATTLSVKQASLDVQHTVLSRLSRKISLKLVKFVDCLKDTYFGTLQRCLESLESSCREELGGRPASEAMRQLVGVACAVDLQPCASFSALRSLIESIRRLLHKLRISGGENEEACCVLSPVWRRQVALTTTTSLTPQRLARLISAQILEKLSVAHEKYQSALNSLESALTPRLHHTEDVKLTIRKKYAPAFARLCLESTSMCDLLMYGVPELGREIGRGQYGVVYAARGGWAGRAPAAVKSVLPADERHYHELAMEFFYTRSIPAHPRIVRLFGSVVQRGGAPCVLLVSERKTRDLHAAVRAGLPWPARLTISRDIVEGIRYLHSLGLVHRDIKLKNVLLDAQDRASLSDLGFCAAGALLSGSVVGTPVHMAPELLHGDYHAAVDVYAFGILFWYVCAGSVKLPTAFEAFQNKEQLWSKVKRGLRPERLPQFTDECWAVMESCWASEPSQRALLGDVQHRLEVILQDALKHEQHNGDTVPRTASDGSDAESIDNSYDRDEL